MSRRSVGSRWHAQEECERGHLGEPGSRRLFAKTEARESTFEGI